MHHITRAVLVAFNAAHQAAATMSVVVRAKLVDMHVKSLSAMVKRAESRIARFGQLASYHRVQAYSADQLAGKAAHAAIRAATLATAEAAKHGVDKQF